MYQKACERGIDHKMAFVIDLMLKIGKMGHFKKLARDQFKNRKETENEILRFWGISKNYENAIT